MRFIRARVLPVLLGCAIILPGLFVVPGCATEEVPASGVDVIQALFERYQGEHPYALTIVQETVRHLPGGRTDTSIWQEALEPGKLRIDFGDYQNGDGVLYLDGILHVFKAGERVQVREDVNPLIILLHDVFHQPVEETASELEGLNYDLSMVRGDDWEGDRVWVVGAAVGDLESAQFWVDQERMQVRRVIQPVGDGAAVLDARIGDYTNADSYSQEQTIVVYVDGDLVQEEQYLKVIPRDSLSPALFDTTSWRISAPYWE